MQKLSKGAAALRAVAEAVYLGMRKVPLSFWDVGARGGLSRPMEILYQFRVMRPLFFEPDPLEAGRLRKTYEEQPLIENVMEFLIPRGFGLIDLQIFGVRSTRAAIQANAFFVQREVHNQRQAAVERVFRSVNRISLAF